jgi:nitrogen-specific signal transduction histidine kinase
MVSLYDVRDLDGDGTWEILLVPGRGRLWVLNERLETILSEDTGEENYLCPIRNGRVCRLIYTSPQSFTLYDIQKTPLMSAKAAITPLGIVSLILAILFLGSLLAFGMTQAQATSFLAQAPCPALLLDRKGRIKRANPKAKALLGEEALSDFRYPPSKSISGCVFHPFSVWGKRLLLLEDKSIHENSERAVTWAGMAQRMAHEFKNPLSTLILATQRLQFQMKGREAVRYTETLLEELQRLRQRVDGFMHFLSLKGPQLSPTDLTVLLARLKEKLSQNLPPEVKIELMLTGHPPMIQADENQLEVAFSNLLDNALAAVGSKGQVTVRVSCDESIRDGERACEIEFADNGPGIPCESQAKLFTPYFTTKPSGSGLGLVIARKVIEDHGGTIKIESKEGIGTRVVVRLPVGKNQ